MSPCYRHNFNFRRNVSIARLQYDHHRDNFRGFNVNCAALDLGRSAVRSRRSNSVEWRERGSDSTCPWRHSVTGFFVSISIDKLKELNKPYSVEVNESGIVAVSRAQHAFILKPRKNYTPRLNALNGPPRGAAKNSNSDLKKLLKPRLDALNAFKTHHSTNRKPRQAQKSGEGQKFDMPMPMSIPMPIPIPIAIGLAYL